MVNSTDLNECLSHNLRTEGFMVVVYGDNNLSQISLQYPPRERAQISMLITTIQKPTAFN